MVIRNKNNRSPHFIFICWENEMKFYIHVLDRLISVCTSIYNMILFFNDIKFKFYSARVFFQVPCHFSFVQALDMFYKVHKVFQLPFNKYLEQAMSFFGAFLFKSQEDMNVLTPKTLTYRNIFDKSVDLGEI